MKTPDDFNVKSVYSYKSSEDLKRYYNDWAMGYDKYAQDVNYILADHIAKVSSTLISQMSLISPVSSVIFVVPINPPSK